MTPMIFIFTLVVTVYSFVHFDHFNPTTLKPGSGSFSILASALTLALISDSTANGRPLNPAASPKAR